MVFQDVSPEEASFQGAFRNFLQTQNIDPQGVFGNIVSNRYAAPTFGAFNLASLINPASVGGGTGNINSFLGGQFNPGGPGILNMAQQARGNLQAAAGGAGISDAARAQFAGAEPGNAAGSDLSNAALLALRGQLPGSVFGRYGGSLVNSAQDQFQNQLAGAAQSGGQAPSFAQALLQALGL